MPLRASTSLRVELVPSSVVFPEGVLLRKSREKGPTSRKTREKMGHPRGLRFLLQ